MRSNPNCFFGVALFIDGSLECIKPSEFVGVRVRNDSVKRSKENMVGRRVEVLRVEVGEFGLDGVVYSNMLSGGMAVCPFEVDDTVLGGPCCCVSGPKCGDEVGLPL